MFALASSTAIGNDGCGRQAYYRLHRRQQHRVASELDELLIGTAAVTNKHTLEYWGPNATDPRTRAKEKIEASLSTAALVIVSVCVSSITKRVH